MPTWPGRGCRAKRCWRDRGIRLLETTLIRVGNEEYAEQNGSYGLTTLQNRHVRVAGETILFAFRGKSGVRHRIDLRDRPAKARVVKRLRDLPGQELFQYRLEAEGGLLGGRLGGRQRVPSRRPAARSFRRRTSAPGPAPSWRRGQLQSFSAFDSHARSEEERGRGGRRRPSGLGNTVAVCRRQCYVHPAVFDAYLDGSLPALLTRRAEPELRHEPGALSPEEAAVLAFLDGRLEAAVAATKAG